MITVDEQTHFDVFPAAAAIKQNKPAYQNLQEVRDQRLFFC